MKIFVCGDSTASPYSEKDAPQMGWGQVLNQFTPGWEVRNAARGGRSTKSFLAEGRLNEIEKEMETGDLLLIQFTHNDTSDLVWRHTDPWTSFQSNLSIFVDTARIHGATPVLMTPICRRYFRDGKLLPSHGDYPSAIRALALTKNVCLIDIFKKSVEAVTEMGDEESKRLFMHVAPGLYPAFPNGQTDDTHTQQAGAEFFAKLTAQALSESGLL